eukprot:CRZ01902.1 hypothetical protein [Spongospora subterranea]
MVNVRSEHERCSRLESLLESCDEIPADIRLMIRSNSLSFGLTPDISAAFICRLFIEFPGLTRQTQNFEDVIEDITRSHSLIDQIFSLLNRDEDLCNDILQEMVSTINKTYTRAGKLYRALRQSRDEWNQMQNRLRRYCLHLLIRRRCNHPMPTIDIRKTKNRSEWSNIDEEMVKVEMGVLQPGMNPNVDQNSRPVDTNRLLLVELISIRHTLLSNYNELQTIFWHYASSEVPVSSPTLGVSPTLNFLELWMMVKDSRLLSPFLTPTVLLKLFDDVAPDVGVGLDTQISIHQFVHLLIKIATTLPISNTSSNTRLSHRFQHVIENNILVWAKRTLENENLSSRSSPRILQTLRPYLKNISSIFLKVMTTKPATSDNRGMMASSISLENIDHIFYEFKLHQCGFTVDDVMDVVRHVLRQNSDPNQQSPSAPSSPTASTIYLPEFIDVLIALSMTRYPNPFEEIATRLLRFLTRDMMLATEKKSC